MIFRKEELMKRNTTFKEELNSLRLIRNVMRASVFVFALLTASLVFARITPKHESEIRLGIGGGYFNVVNIHLTGGYRSGAFLGTPLLRSDSEIGVGYGFGHAFENDRYTWEYDRLGRKH
jgi:hypothetical protein